MTTIDELARDLLSDDTYSGAKGLAAALTRPGGDAAIRQALQGLTEPDPLQTDVSELLELPGGSELLSFTLRYLTTGRDAAELEPLLTELLRLPGGHKALAAILLTHGSGTADEASAGSAHGAGFVGGLLESLTRPGTATAERRDLDQTLSALKTGEAAETILTEMIGDKLNGTAARKLGLSVLEIDPVLLGGQGDDLAQITVGKRINDRLAFAYSTVLDGDEQSSIEVRWRVREHLELRPALESTGSYVLEARFVQDFAEAAGRRRSASRVTLPGLLQQAGEPAAHLGSGIDHDPKIMVGDIRILGLRQTRARTVARELAASGLTPGSPLDPTALLDAQRSLHERRLFSSVEVFSVPSQRLQNRDVIVHVEERPAFRLEVGGGLDDEQGPRLALSLHHRNLRGRGAALSLNLLGGEDEREATLSVSMPRLRQGSDHLLLSLSGREEVLPGLTEQRWGLGAQLSHRFRKLRHTTAQIHYEIEDVSLSDVRVTDVLSQDEGTFARLGLAVVHDHRDDPLNPSRGTLAAFDVSLSTGVLGSSSEYGAVNAQHTGFWRFGRRLRYRSTTRLGAGWSFEGTDRLPVAERFLIGGLGSVRGYRRNSLGPRDEVSGEPIGGDSYLTLSQELTVELPKRFSASAFFDVGGVYETPKQFDFAELASSVGLGLGYASPIGPLRIYWAYGLDAPPDTEPGRVHFAYGPLYF